MKRILSLLLALVMVVGMLPASTLAAQTTEGPVIYYETTFEPTMSKGDTFTVTAYLRNNPGLGAATIELDWNQDAVKFNGFTTYTFRNKEYLDSEVITMSNGVWSQELGTLAFTGIYVDDNNTDDGYLFIANFEVIAGGSLNIGINDGQNTLIDGKQFELATIAGPGEFTVFTPEFDTSALDGLTASGDKIVNMPEDAPFTAITTDAGGILDIEEMNSVGGVPYYVVTIPADATTAYVTAPDQVVMEDKALGKNMATAYAADIGNSWSPLYISYNYEDTAEGPKVEIPMYMTASDFTGGEVELCFVETEDASATHAFGIENSRYACLGYISFKYGEASSAPEEPVRYAVTVKEASNGTVAADKETAEKGETVTVTATPTDGYQLVKVLVNGEPIEGNSFTMPGEAVTVTAEFELIPIPTYSVTVGDVSNGTLTVDKAAAAEDETVTVTATPTDGYQLVKVLVNGEPIEGNSFTMPGEAVTVTAEFELLPPATYAVNIGDISNGTVSVDKATAAAGETVTVTATPAEGYQLVEVMVDGEAINGTTFTMPAQNVTVTATFTAVQPPEQPQVKGYSITMDTDKTGIMVGENTVVSLAVDHDKLDHYNSYKLELTYDPSKVTLTTATDDNNNIAVSDKDGSVIITRFGENLSASIDLTFTAAAPGEAEVKLTKAYISDTDAALKGDAPAASIIDDGEIAEVGITTITVTGYDVDLSQDFSSTQQSLAPGEDLHFTTTISPYYNYEIVVQVQNADGSWTTLKDVEIKGSGTAEDPYVIDSEYISGNIFVSAPDKEGKLYDVKFEGDYAEALAPAQDNETVDGKAQYMMKNGYSAVLTPDSKFEYTVEITIGDSPYTCTPKDNVYTIPGEDITGTIVFTVNAEQVAFDPHNVTINGSGKDDVVDGTAADTVQHNDNYTFDLKMTDGWDYTVTATMGGTGIPAVKAETANADGSFTYTISGVTGTLVITIEKTNLKVEVHEYLDLDERSMFLITATKDLAEGQTALAYEGNTMFYSERYQAWAYLVIVEEGETFTVDTAKTKISVGSTEFKTIPGTLPDMLDVNMSGVVDINDAQLVYDMYAAKKYTDLTQSDIMEKLLRADITQGDSAKMLDVLDARAVVADILK